MSWLSFLKGCIWNNVDKSRNDTYPDRKGKRLVGTSAETGELGIENAVQVVLQSEFNAPTSRFG